jgi:phosphoribosylanthranilate isomerase
MAIKVKICGITNLEDAIDAVGLGADCLGFVFYKNSKRNIEIENAKKIIAQINSISSNSEKNFFETKKGVLTAGIFVDAELTAIDKIIRETGIDIIQLSGNETINYIENLKKYGYERNKIVKAIHINNESDITRVRQYEALRVNILLDTYAGQGVYGGTGTVFNWNIIKSLDLSDKIIAGGVSPANINYINNNLKPYGVDLSSKIEKFPGKKDYDKMKLLFDNTK